ncbi:unnamed protein product [Effrenium voratum]|uniref:Uncharacterized protein n=2 Tax=Effrenium voratum TaxID=2562239 RepID=A0AA36JRH4_9DINO|nr:unnamed protein product [Effrenium voratum]CAJ1413694.1 unnamed protein product [Effrenium voratum]
MTACALWQQLVPSAACVLVVVTLLFLLHHRAKTRNAASRATDIIVVLQCNILASNTAALVDAYDVSASVGQSVAFSGLFIGIFMAGSLLGAAFLALVQNFQPDLWRQARATMMAALTLYVAGPILYCVPTGLIYAGKGGGALGFLLLCSRLLQGLGAGAASQLGLVCIAKGSGSQKSRFMVRFLFSNMLGCGLGPLLASFYHAASPCLGDFGIQFWQLGVMQSILAFGVLLAVALLFPALDDDLEMAREASQDPEESASKRKVVVGCLVMTCLRGYLISSLEGATALFLQQKYGWELKTIGFFVALTLLASIPAKLLQGQLAKCLSEKWLVRLFGMAAIAGAALICLQDGWLLLLADCLLFPCIYLADAIGRGVMARHLLPQGWLDANRTSCYTLFLGGMGQFAGPWVTRWYLELLPKQVLYAGSQASVSVLFLLTFELLVRPNMQRPEQKDATEDSVAGERSEKLDESSSDTKTTSGGDIESDAL